LGPASHVPNKPRFSAEHLTDVVAGLFERAGVPADDAWQAADVLVLADLRGVESHGVSNMLRRYLEYYASGLVNPRPAWRVVQAPATANVDGDAGLGIIVAPRVMQIAIDKARVSGVGVVTVHNCSHLGMAQYHALLAVPADMIGVCTSATPPFMVPVFGRDPRLGTNPIAVAAPCAKEPPFVFDAATTVVAGNKISTFSRLGKLLPGGLLPDAEGRPILEPRPAPDDYSRLLPLGSTPETGAHKGYGLACIVEVLSHVLGGSTFSMQRPDTYGHLLMAIDIAAFSPVDEFKRTMDAYLRTLKATPPAAGHERVLVPGQLEAEAEADRRANGIPLHPEVIGWFAEVGAPL
jgi:LDH2 family malate/lactate/ureidoglycolate dehydrogenase